MTRSIAALICLSLVLGACASPGPSGGGSAPDPGSTPGPGSTPRPDPNGIELAALTVPRIDGTDADARAAGGAITAFGLDVYRHVAADGGNVVVSPTSIAIALAMARAGARGTTADQMDAVLRELATDEHAAWVSALDQALAERTRSVPMPDGDPAEVTLRIANAPFAQRDYPLEPAYLEALGGRFGAGLQLVDYIGDAEAARGLINDWVSEQTEARIPELLAPGTVDLLTRLVLVNAIYLKAGWLYPFDVAATSDGRFSRPDGSSVEVPMMAVTTDLGYADGDGWAAVELPYVGGDLAMTIVVPDDLDAFVADLDPDSLEAIVGALERVEVDLQLPRFGIETRTELADVLGALGMPDAFDDRAADFSGITTEEELYISAVVHQANIDVDEEGTEAAAATAVIVNTLSAPTRRVSLSVDRPFLFVLRDVPTGAVLFLGQVVDPSSD